MPQTREHIAICELLGIDRGVVAAGASGDNDNGFDSGSAYVFLIDPVTPGDLNCDGAINAFDIEPFLELLFP